MESNMIFYDFYAIVHPKRWTQSTFLGILHYFAHLIKIFLGELVHLLLALGTNL